MNRSDERFSREPMPIRTNFMWADKNLLRGGKEVRWAGPERCRCLPLITVAAVALRRPTGEGFAHGI
jgi:hypothetical protein